VFADHRSVLALHQGIVQPQVEQLGYTIRG
jgi:hypothetical protein